MKRLWLVETGQYYSDKKYHFFVCATKKLAEKLCREAGYIYSKKDDYWNNEHDQLWRHVTPVDFYV